MRLALLIGNRYTPWHFAGYRLLRDHPAITVFRAHSEIQRYFDERNDSDFGFTFERLRFDTESCYPLRRFLQRSLDTYRVTEPHILPFHNRLKGFDLIQSWELFTDWSDEALNAHRKFGIPLVVMVWDNIPFNMERSFEQRERKRRVIDGADLFVVHTERSRQMLALEGVAEDRVALVPPGVDTDLFCPGPGDRAAFGLSDEDFVVLFVGWFLPRKGLDFLLMAVAKLVSKPALSKRRIRVLIVGSGPGRPRIDALIRRLGLGETCLFAGSLPYSRMPEAFRSTDVFVLPSVATPDWQEQFGMSLIEAMACGIPAITTYSGAIPEIAGDSALLIQPNDFVSLAEALRRLIQDPALRHELSASGRARALERFTLAAFAGALSSAHQAAICSA